MGILKDIAREIGGKNMKKYYQLSSDEVRMQINGKLEPLTAQWLNGTADCSPGHGTSKAVWV